MACVRRSLSTLGASQDAIGFVEDAYRAGTRKVYDSRWQRWSGWCRVHNVDPVKPSNVDLANFLAQLAAQDRLAPNTVKVYRSAIVTSLTQMGGRVRGESSQPHLIRDVVRGIEARSASTPRRVPLWDMHLVLEALRSPPFEPLRSLDRATLTKKTAFLVMLASGRRASEVNALSGLASSVGRDSDGGFILKFLPEFRAKNQAASERSPVVRIPPLSKILGPDDEDRYLCPVRALKHYLNVTSPTRPETCRKLFISINPNFAKDVSVSTVSRWVSDVVKLAYATKLESLPSSRAHEVRAWAASLALEHSVALQDILDAAFWKSESTFANFYLRDSRIQRADGSCGIATLAVSQQVISTSQ